MNHDHGVSGSKLLFYVFGIGVYAEGYDFFRHTPAATAVHPATPADRSAGDGELAGDAAAATAHHHREGSDSNSDVAEEVEPKLAASGGKVKLNEGQSRAMQDFIKIRGIEVILETLPCGALQVYVAIVSQERSAVTTFSIVTSLLALGYGVMAALADFPDQEVI